MKNLISAAAVVIFTIMFANTVHASSKGDSSKPKKNKFPNVGLRVVDSVGAFVGYPTDITNDGTRACLTIDLTDGRALGVFVFRDSTSPKRLSSFSVPQNASGDYSDAPHTATARGEPALSLL